MVHKWKMSSSRTSLKLVTIFVMLWSNTFNTYIYLWLNATLKLTYCLVFNKIDIIAIFITKSFLPALFKMFTMFSVQINPLK